MVKPGNGLTELFNRVEAVRDKDNRPPIAAELVDLLGALSREVLIANRQHLVNEQHIGFHVCCNSETKADEHAT